MQINSSLARFCVVRFPLNMRDCLPEDKLLKCKQLIAEFIKKKATLRELQSLTGVLNFACSVVVPGRCFLR